MAFHGNKDVNADEVALLTDNDVTSITVQNQTGYTVRLIGAADATPPAADAAGLELAPGAVVLNEALADLFPGIAAVRVFAVGVTGSGRLMVSHA
ncbi:hypothetical protein [Salipiger mangrovisoli]|uniref:Uncharacterized protein n=1 Tax=Salipiger mangrovisoli TaxID=2865933 RepID=A0ABR9WX08_9RHOB|nr:hypothetical protein [Salipiger mangrovisoli]MBE9635792.1 hypothetical protein [Salipiger mangrovisoli]